MNKSDQIIKNRRSVRLKNFNYSSPGYYFVTICTFNRQPLFGCIKNEMMFLSNIGEVVQENIIGMKKILQGIKVDDFIVMPNHIHIIIHIIQSESQGSMNQTPTLGEIVRQFKARCTRQIHSRLNVTNKIWQRNYHEHVIRNDEAFHQISEYIRTNPQKWEEDRYYMESKAL